MKTRKGYTPRTLGKETILIAEGLEAVDFSRMISMNDSAAYLWKAVEDKDFDAETLVNLLIEEYDIAHEVAERDVTSLLQAWKEANIVIDD